MPNVKDFKEKQNRKQATSDGGAPATTETEARPKRRPGREEPEASTADVKVVDVEEGIRAESTADDLHKAHVDNEKRKHAPSEEPEAGPKVEIHFFGSELIRAKLPKPFEVAEAVATDWVHGGTFDHLPIEQPLAKYVAQKGLQRAKEVEKKVLESPVTEKVAMKALTAGLKAQALFEQLRSRLKKD